jgi:hypothetical protein
MGAACGRAELGQLHATDRLGELLKHAGRLDMAPTRLPGAVMDANRRASASAEGDQPEALGTARGR